MIGDPSGRSTERNLLDVEHARGATSRPIRVQLERFLDFTPDSGAVMVNNLDWLGELSLIDFLRDTGKHFTIPYMLAKDSVQVRLERGLSFTEFSYMLLQAYDFAAPPPRRCGVELQMGGADQWGNITAGLELIRRTTERRRDGRRRIRPTGSPTSCCCRRRGPSSARARAAIRSGSTRRGPRRTRSTSTGSTPTTATSAPTCAGSPSSSRDEIEALEAELARAPEGRRGAARARPATSPPGRTAPRRPRRRSPIPRPCSRPRRSPTRPSSPRSTSRPAGSRSIRRCVAAGASRSLLAEAGAVRLAGRGAADDRGRRRDGQRRRG